MNTNDELRALCEEDLADARTFRGDEAFLASQARRGRVEALVAAGALHTAEDYYHARASSSTASACWIVGGQLPRDDLTRLAASLP